MKMCWSNEIDPVLCVGLPLMDMGINNWALEADQALAAIRQLGDRGIAVLGGDVFIKDAKEVRPCPDSWCCERREAESPAVFVQRSCQAALEYVSAYHRKNLEETPLFALLPRADGWREPAGSGTRRSAGGDGKDR
jgi:hypothetical protein